MRDKLIELIDDNKACPFDDLECSECEYSDITPCFPVRLADALIANGVTFAEDNNVGKWIPVSERLPDANGVYLSVDDMGIYSFRVFDPDKRMWKAIWEDEKATHWMPLPEPPKEGE